MDRDTFRAALVRPFCFDGLDNKSIIIPKGTIINIRVMEILGKEQLVATGLGYQFIITKNDYINNINSMQDNKKLA